MFKFFKREKKYDIDDFVINELTMLFQHGMLERVGHPQDRFLWYASDDHSEKVLITQDCGRLLLSFTLLRFSFLWGDVGYYVTRKPLEDEWIKKKAMELLSRE